MYTCIHIVSIRMHIIVHIFPLTAACPGRAGWRQAPPARCIHYIHMYIYIRIDISDIRVHLLYANMSFEWDILHSAVHLQLPTYLPTYLPAYLYMYTYTFIYNMYAYIYMHIRTLSSSDMSSLWASKKSRMRSDRDANHLTAST
jgi:hypothetical protein